MKIVEVENRLFFLLLFTIKQIYDKTNSAHTVRLHIRILCKDNAENPMLAALVLDRIAAPASQAYAENGPSLRGLQTRKGNRAGDNFERRVFLKNNAKVLLSGNAE